MTTSPILRAAQSADAEAIWAVRVAAIQQGCRHHYSPELLQQWTAAPMPQTFPERLVEQGFIVADRAGQIVGFAGLHRERQEIDAVFVDPAHRGQKIGVALLAAVESAACDLGMQDVSLKASLNAVAFYTAAGYHPTGDGWHVTQGGLQIACVHMQKSLCTAAAP